MRMRRRRRRRTLCGEGLRVGRDGEARVGEREEAGELGARLRVREQLGAELVLQAKAIAPAEVAAQLVHLLELHQMHAQHLQGFHHLNQWANTRLLVRFLNTRTH